LKRSTWVLNNTTITPKKILGKMDPIPFYKMSGAGNDFIIIDNRQHIVDDTNLTDFISSVCRRKMSAGADGLILIESSEKCDFRWRFFNSDGSKAEMCGNGARCAARFAHLNAIAGTSLSFETEAGVIQAQISQDRVKVKMPAASDLKLAYPLSLSHGSLAISSINTGVPHVVVMVEQIDNIDVVALGKEIRFHQAFAPAGTNANFVYRSKPNEIIVISACQLDMKSPIDVQTRSGAYLTIHFSETDGQFNEIYMEGDARIIYSGELQPDAWQ
jgi:diaminopimelate epimerase